jgi:hypothetical protein
MSKPSTPESREKDKLRKRAERALKRQRLAQEEKDAQERADRELMDSYDAEDFKAIENCIDIELDDTLRKGKEFHDEVLETGERYSVGLGRWIDYFVMVIQQRARFFGPTFTDFFNEMQKNHAGQRLLRKANVKSPADEANWYSWMSHKTF